MDNLELYSERFEKVENSVGRNALLLALTKNVDEEMVLKKIFKEAEIKCVVTEIGGKTNETLQEKINNAVIGAILNANIAKKTSKEMHAILHAAEEAKTGIIVNRNSILNVALKIAIVRNENWVAVAMYGISSLHSMTSHERCGLGIMHI